jgi:alpha-tubulin suppressor-like RCC1 family protein
MKKAFTSIIILCSIMVLFGCPEFLQNHGSLVLELDSDMEAKSIDLQTSVEITQYNIRGKGPGNETFEVLGVTSTTHTQMNLIPGEWKIDVVGVNNSHKELSIGTKTVTIAERKTTYTSILCIPLEGEGTVTLTLTWPTSEIGTPRIEAWIQMVRDIHDEMIRDEDNTITMTPGTGTATGTKNVQAGTYVVGIELYDDYGSGKLVWSTMESPRIYAGQTSAGAWNLTSSDISSIESGGVNVNVESFINERIDVQINATVTQSAEGAIIKTQATLEPDPSIYKWYLDGELLSNRYLYTTIGPISELGNHTLTLLAYYWGYGGMYSGIANFRFTVEEQTDPADLILSWGLRGDHLGNDSWGDVPAPVEDLPPIQFKLLTGSEYASYAIDADGYLWVWGKNNVGQLGFYDSSIPSSQKPIKHGSFNQSGDSPLKKVSAKANRAIALNEAGQVFIWGEMGDVVPWDDGTADGASIVYYPKYVSDLGSSIVDVASGLYHFAAVDSSGSVWTWGWNHSGELGDGTNEDRRKPVKISMPSGVSFTKVAAGDRYTLALDTQDRVWAWGNNGEYAFGRDSPSTSNVPVIVSGFVGKEIVSIECGGMHNAALDSSGNLYMWGSTSWYALGNPDPPNYPAPFQLACPGGRKTFSSIVLGWNFSLAQTSDGLLWAWGDEDACSATGTSSTVQTPRQVLWLTNKTIRIIGAGAYHSLIGLDW